MNYSNHLLGDIATTHRGLAVPRARVSIDNEIPYLHYGDIYKIYDNYFDVEKLKDSVIKINSDEKIKDYQYLHTGDIVINLTSENYEDLGKSIYIKNDNSMLVSGMETIIIRFNSELFDPLFLNYYFDTNYFYNDIMQYVRGMKVFRVNPKDLLRAKLPEIPKDHQIQIASFIKSLDDKIELNNKINKNLEEIAQALYKQWFVDFEFPNKNGEPYKSSGGEMVESELGLIPKGWEVKELGEILDIKYGKNYPTKNLLDEGFPVFGGNGVIGYSERYIYKEPHTLVACRGAASGKVQVSLPKSFVTNNSLVLLHNDKLNYAYLKELSIYREYYDFVTGSAQPQITIASISKCKIILPKYNVQEMFAKVINNTYFRILNNYLEFNKLTNLRDTLLPKLMSGEIEVPIKEG